LFDRLFKNIKGGCGKNLGEYGEDVAVSYLKKRGYKIIKRNFRCVLGEIDIIAKKDSYLVFVEVKTRKQGAEIMPEDSINYEKERRLKKIAEFYINNYCWEDIECRFDVLSIIIGKDEEVINIIEDAF